MRISKVKVDKNRMVLMHRNVSEGALVYEGNTLNKTLEILPAKKLDNFNLSILNRTIIKEDYCKKLKLNESRFREIKEIFQDGKLPGRITKDGITPYLNHRFQVKMKFVDDGATINFNLTDLIFKAVQNQNINELEPYEKWKSWYIKTKSAFLKKSILSNRIDFDQNLSKRKRCLQTWASTYSVTGSLDLSCYHETYKIEELSNAFLHVDRGELSKNGVPKNMNTYHRELKKALQSHQQIVFGTRETPNTKNREDDKLAIYHLEVVKYLEHYFSVKTTQRRNSKDDIDYYLNENTIKNTIRRQLQNAITNYSLQQGKAQLHGFDSKTDSTTLTDIKRNEGFVLNMIDACAFAANNIRNIIDTKQLNDILGKNDYTDSIKENRINPLLFRFFFNTKLPNENPEKEKTLWAMRGAVQQIRNKVIHYRQKALNEIFEMPDFESSTIGNRSYSETIYKRCFKEEIDNVPAAFAEQLKTGGVLTYFPLDKLKILLNTFTFSLCRSVIPFAPGFKKIHKQGQNYQNASIDDFYNLELTIYLPTKQFGEKEYGARYFLLKLIYNYSFLPEFTRDVEQFRKSVQFVQELNKKQAERSRNKHAYAFEGVRLMKKDESVLTFMSYIQSQLLIEQDLKESDKIDITKMNFEKFVLQIFIKGFDTYLRANEFKFLEFPAFQLSNELNKQQQSDKLNDSELTIAKECKIKPQSVNAEKPEHIAFYIFCKLLDANHLSNLRNELIKYKQSISTDDFKFSHVFEIIELCLLRADVVPTDYKKLYKDEIACFNRIMLFVENGADVKNWSDLFVQTDKVTPVVHANVELTVKYGTANLLERLISKDSRFKLTESDFISWNNAQKTIETLINKRIDLHDKWVDAKNKDDKEKSDKTKEKSNFAQKFIDENKKDYIDQSNAIDTYIWLDNKLHFVHLNRLQNLIIDILGRMAGFIALWDRDFQMLDARRTDDSFLLKSFISLRELDDNLKKTNKPIDQIKDIESVVKRNGNNIDEADRNSLISCIQNKKEYFKRIFFNPNQANPFYERNYIAHFSYLTKDTKSLIDLINIIRNLLWYDRKLKNAVTRAFIDLFKKHGMVLKLKLNASHQFEIKSLEPQLIYHLGTNCKSKNPITSNQVHPLYCEMCKCLLEMEKKC
jgi:hypothetical protein